jgi:hypothetical protein
VCPSINQPGTFRLGWNQVSAKVTRNPATERT